jgi:hypothetical protein
VTASKGQVKVSGANSAQRQNSMVSRTPTATDGTRAGSNLNAGGRIGLRRRR